MLFMCKIFMLCFQMLSEKKFFLQEMAGGGGWAGASLLPLPLSTPFVYGPEITFLNDYLKFLTFIVLRMRRKL